MSSIPHLTGRQLRKVLRKQGFDIVETSDGWIARSPKGKTSAVHDSSLKQDRSYRNTISQLRSIGLVLGRR